ncbi:tigger transposable element-derived protein 4-like [Portunus trituberculatus]|uniref:tigger transposable element-derived protein 4-like n=1 Tax=Portunus trituberculatus TaxID=210409 RepID=UPI001E1D1D6C|nr:tigger transposable element-derived protein 4-like [Portunus trituberculatus]XP_045108903.1 tigger transposable element-derived protein 4-like [Portunus trituberculatus]XP_045108904.1 tigger transposable element-derived protein 4-like [Portunus trituberculatus]
MEDLHRGTCTELERLAAAAATMDYSESLANSHQPALTVAAPILTTQFPPDHYQRQYARHDTHLRSYEQVPRPPPSAHHQAAPPAHVPPPPTIQYVAERPAHYTRTSQFVSMVDLQYNNTQVMAPLPGPEAQYPPPPPQDMPQQPAVVPPPSPALETVPKEKKKVPEPPQNKKRKTEEREKQEALEEDSLRREDKDNAVLDLPQPITDTDGSLVYPCSLCTTTLSSADAWQEHAADHLNNANRRRNGLSLEVKIEIIKRINSGEKQSDMAEEYMVNRSTIKSIMKKSSSYLQCWKKGMFHPDSKRLKGPKREDIEAALYSWYKQAVSTGTPVSGPILCSKALAFAKKLGHNDFKATHGWLDRFKKRKNIVFGRAPARRKREEEENSNTELKPSEWQTAVLHQLLLEYDPGDIFAVEEIGLLYRTLPGQALALRGERCAGGVRSRMRLTVLLCGNMTGTEKFPLLVVGKHPKPSSFRHVKSLPVQYVANQKAWMTGDSFGAWLQDVDSWFVQQGRRVVVVASALPIHDKPPSGLRSVRMVTAPSGFVGPLKQGVSAAFKRNYRRGLLETLVNQLQRDEPASGKRGRRPNTKLSLLTCLHHLATAWHSVTDSVISASFTRAGMCKYGAWGAPPPPPDPTLGSENLTLLHRLRLLGLAVPDMTFDDFVHFDHEVQTCNLNNDDDILAIVTGADKDDEGCGDDDEEEEEEGEEEEGEEESEHGPSLTQVEAALATLRKHIQYQEGAQEMFRVLAHLEYLIYKGQVGAKGVGVQPTTSTAH